MTESLTDAGLLVVTKGDREVWQDIDGNPVVVNETNVPTGDVLHALEQNREWSVLARSIASHIGSWTEPSDARTRRKGNLFDRDRYVTPSNILEQMKTAKSAARNDDIISGVLEVTESLAFNRITFESSDPDEEDIFNQVAAEIDLDSRIREIWRDLIIVSQVYVAVLWGHREFRVRGVGDSGRPKRRVFNGTVPIAVSLLDPLKVVPVRVNLFGPERLAYIADEFEGVQFDDVLAGKNTTDLVVLELIEQRYQPTEEERRILTEAGIDHKNLFLLRQDRVFRHTLTKPRYERFADVRMASVFELLDLKHQLRSRERANLVGGSSYIVLVRKGTDDRPAKPAEIRALSTQMRQMARIPVIVGDHRLQIDIVAPDDSNTLKAETHNTIDARVAGRMYGLFVSGNFQAGTRGDDSIKLARVVGKGIESRRHMIRRVFEEHIIKPTKERNPDQFKSDVSLRFYPKHVSLTFDPDRAQQILELRARGELSRQTGLAEFDFSQNDEARKREKERDMGYDEIFSTAIPFSSPEMNPFGPGGNQRNERPDDEEEDED